MNAFSLLIHSFFMYLNGKDQSVCDLLTGATKVNLCKWTCQHPPPPKSLGMPLEGD